MGASALFENAIELKEVEARQRVQKREYELDYEEEVQKEKQLRRELRNAEIEKDACVLPDSEDEENGDEDTEKIKRLDEQIGWIKSAINDSMDRQEKISDDIKKIDNLISNTMHKKDILLNHINSDIDDHNYNIHTLSVNAGIYDGILRNVSDGIENELSILILAQTLLNSDVGTLIPKVGEFLNKKTRKSSEKSTLGKSTISTAIRMAMLGVSGQISGMVFTLLMPFIRPALHEMVFNPRDEGTIRGALRHFMVETPFRMFAFISDTVEFIPNPNYQRQPSDFEKTVDYGKRTIDNIWKGNYSKEEPTALSVGASIALSFTSADIVMDARDLAYDFQNFSTVSKWQFALDVVGAIPVVGIVKKFADLTDAAKLVKHVDEPIQYMAKYSDEVISVVGNNAGDFTHTTFKSFADVGEAMFDVVGEGEKAFSKSLTSDTGGIVLKSNSRTMEMAAIVEFGYEPIRYLGKQSDEAIQNVGRHISDIRFSYDDLEKAILESSYSKQWGVGKYGENQGISHYVWKSITNPSRLPSLAERLGIDKARFFDDFGRVSVKGFENFTVEARSAIEKATQNGNIFAESEKKIRYFVEGAINSKKGVEIITFDNKISSMMPRSLKDWLKNFD